MDDLTIGLFGTCGHSIWRNNFIEKYSEMSISYYNPQLAPGTWTPDDADIENKHFLNDDIILFPITDETTAFGSLAEAGFSVLSLLHSANPNRHFIVMIDDNCVSSDGAQACADSIRTRKLVKSKIQDLIPNYNNLHIVNDLDEIMSLSLSIYAQLIQGNK